MVGLSVIQQSNSLLGTLPSGLVALFIGATTGIGQGTLQHLARNASSPRIYSVSRPASAANHETFLSSLRQANPNGTYNLIEADVSLVSEVDRVVDAVVAQEKKLDILFLSAGFMPFQGRQDTAEGLDPSMSTRYYSRLRAVEQLLPLLNQAKSPRIVTVLAGGLEGPIQTDDLDLRHPNNWSTWASSVQSATMGTLALELLVRQNRKLSVVHWFPGPVDTPGLARAKRFGMSQPNAMSQDEAGARGLFLATSDRYAVKPGDGVPVPQGLGAAKRTGGGIFLADPSCESADSERVLAEMRASKVDELVWNFTQKVFARVAGKSGKSKDEL